MKTAATALGRLPRPQVRWPQHGRVTDTASTHGDQRQQTLHGPFDVDTALRCWQLAMAEEADWLPMVAERPNEACWLAMASDGARIHYRVHFEAHENIIRISEHWRSYEVR